jgi:hypothetical protein
MNWENVRCFIASFFTPRLLTDSIEASESVQRPGVKTVSFRAVAVTIVGCAAAAWVLRQGGHAAAKRRFLCSLGSSRTALAKNFPFVFM